MYKRTGSKSHKRTINSSRDTDGYDSEDLFTNPEKKIKTTPVDEKRSIENKSKTIKQDLSKYSKQEDLLPLKKVLCVLEDDDSDSDLESNNNSIRTYEWPSNKKLQEDPEYEKYCYKGPAIVEGEKTLLYLRYIHPLEWLYYFLVLTLGYKQIRKSDSCFLRYGKGSRQNGKRPSIAIRCII